MISKAEKGSKCIKGNKPIIKQPMWKNKWK